MTVVSAGKKKKKSLGRYKLNIHKCYLIDSIVRPAPHTFTA